jgi:competence protein ComEC
VAIISVGVGNRFGHPAPETLQALQDVGAQVYRTDLNGTVEVIADKEHIWLRTDR